MYYVKTNTDNYEITTSYVTEKQARRYGGEPELTEICLMTDGFTNHIEKEPSPHTEQDLTYIGHVRTIFRSKRDGIEPGNFLLYMRDDEDTSWEYAGIFFATMSDGNQAIKGPLSGTYGDMIIVEVDGETRDRVRRGDNLTVNATGIYDL